MLDGALARATGKITKAGAILDSVLDRYSEAVVLAGLVVYYLYASPSNLGVILVFVTLTGSMMVSYTRARAEALGIDCKVGFFTRPERVILIAAGLILNNWFNALLYILPILAIGTLATALWRLIYILRKADKPSDAGDEDQST
jgi:CDP-diacylglycerol--glycerol-3-phosphate 3-phosphatidyltransferase